MVNRGLLAGLMVVLAGCGGTDPGGPPAPGALSRAALAASDAAPVRTGPTAPQVPASLDGLGPVGSPELQRPQADSGYSLDVSQREAVRLFYKTVFASSSNLASGWTGNAAACAAGDTTADYKAATLRRINWFRAMAGVPASVQLDDTFNAKAQQAALMMAANNQLSHTPPASWACYSAVGAEAAAKSNLALGRAGADSVAEGYMRDSGANNAAVGHRRWLLYPQTQRMGAGDADGSVKANALWVFDANIAGPRPSVRDDFVAWPPAGYVPHATLYPRWSFSYPQADFSAASVAMTEDGAPMATRLEAVSNGAGENTLVWFPGSYADGMNWARPAGDTVYRVTVSNVRVGGVARSFSYTVVVFDADVATSSITLAGSSAVQAGQAASYSFAAQPGATGYQWRSLGVAPFNLADGAEAGSGNFSVATSAGYEVVANGVSATGARSFHLAHTQATDQTLLLNAVLVPGAGGVLQFSSRLGLASPSQLALVELSQDDGASWVPLFQQAGQQSGTTSNFGETGFSTKTISLAPYAGRTIRLRWRYAFSSGSFYPQASAGIGWYVDDITLTGVDTLAAAGTPAEIASPAFSFTGSSAGTVLLQARAGMFGYWGDWSAARTVSVSAGAVSIAGADCLFNWAERNHPALFAPSGAASATSAPYYYRFYAGTRAYLGVSTVDGNVYYLAGNRLDNVGPLASWRVTAGCNS